MRTDDDPHRRIRLADGHLRVPGQNQLRGYQLCIKQANENGGVLERKLELVTADDQSQSALAVKIYEKLITQDKVNAILGRTRRR